MNLELSDDEVQLLQMALCEYVASRGPTVSEYVERRYSNPNFSEEWKAQKWKDVHKRLELADKLRERLFPVE